MEKIEKLTHIILFFWGFSFEGRGCNRDLLVKSVSKPHRSFYRSAYYKFLQLTVIEILLSEHMSEQCYCIIYLLFKS